MKLLVAVSVAFFSYWLIMLFFVLTSKRKIRVREALDEIETQNKETKKSSKRKKGKKFEFRFIHISNKMRDDILLSGLKMRPEEFIIMWLFLTIGPGFLFYSISSNLLQSIIITILGFLIPPVCMKKGIQKRRALFELQLGDALLVLSNGLRAGFSFTQALDNIIRDLPEPINNEFSNMSRELKFGMDIETAMSKVASRMESGDMKLLTTAVVVQRQVGGNLTEILDSISKTIRERQEIKRTVKTLTAQGRISGKIIGLLPIGLLGMISFINPDYMAPLYTTAYGYMLLMICGALELIGFLMISKIVNLKF